MPGMYFFGSSRYSKRISSLQVMALFLLASVYVNLQNIRNISTTKYIRLYSSKQNLKFLHEGWCSPTPAKSSKIFKLLNQKCAHAVCIILQISIWQYQQQQRVQTKQHRHITQQIIALFLANYQWRILSVRYQSLIKYAKSIIKWHNTALISLIMAFNAAQS